MKTLTLICACMFLPSLGNAKVPSEAQLSASVEALKVPSLERRLKARATAYRLVAATAKMMGFGEDALVSVKRDQYASLESKK